MDRVGLGGILGVEAGGAARQSHSLGRTALSGSRTRSTVGDGRKRARAHGHAGMRYQVSTGLHRHQTVEQRHGVWIGGQAAAAVAVADAEAHRQRSEGLAQAPGGAKRK